MSSQPEAAGQHEICPGCALIYLPAWFECGINRSAPVSRQRALRHGCGCAVDIRTCWTDRSHTSAKIPRNRTYVPMAIGPIGSMAIRCAGRTTRKRRSNSARTIARSRICANRWFMDMMFSTGQLARTSMGVEVSRHMTIGRMNAENSANHAATSRRGKDGRTAAPADPCLRNRPSVDWPRGETSRRRASVH